MLEQWLGILVLDLVLMNSMLKYSGKVAELIVLRHIHLSHRRREGAVPEGLRYQSFSPEVTECCFWSVSRVPKRVRGE